jgi:hypothetical protein
MVERANVLPILVVAEVEKRKIEGDDENGEGYVRQMA